MWELVFLLLPVAALSGWWIGRRVGVVRAVGGGSLSKDYYVGLNYLLDEQPDKAVDAFIRMLDVSSESVETTLALGNLFRRRGEVDKAIRLHQKLIAKPTLTSYQRVQSLLELGQDYMRAGVYDRAESLFQELTNTTGLQLITSLQHLIDIYEREKDWEKAILVAKRLQQASGQFMGREVAHYYCELSQQLLEKGHMQGALKHLQNSLTHDRNCVRASILQGDIEKKVGNFKLALKAYQRVQHQDVDFVPEIISKVVACYKVLNADQGLANYLTSLLKEAPSISIILANAERIYETACRDKSTEFLAVYLRAHPSIRGLKKLVDLHLTRDLGGVREDLLMLRSLFDKLLENKPIYRCGRCGFGSKAIHWQCPSCRIWASVKPIQGIEGE